jgi:glycerophosphoryl diester phosphodiesterase
MRHAALILTDVARDFRRTWRALAAAHVLYSILAFCLLTPAATLPAHLLVSLSGSAALTDEDILAFALRPVGLVALSVCAAIALAVAALEYAAMMAVGFGAVHGRSIGWFGALHFAALHLGGILRLTTRCVAWLLLTAAPFLVTAAAVYVLLLRKYDINYYLAERSPVFWVAGGLIGGIVTAMVVVLSIRLVSWTFAMPLMLFDGVPPSRALRASREATAGQRGTLAGWLVGWFIASSAVSAGATGTVGLVGRAIVPDAGGSLVLIAMSAGTVLVLVALVNVAVAFVNTAALCLLVIHLFRRAGYGAAPDALEAIREQAVKPKGRWMPSRRQVVAAALVGLIVAAGTGFALMRLLAVEDRVDVIAHRGASAAAPENTLAAIARAIRDEADWVEIDVHETADGEIAVIHDGDLKRVAGADLSVGSATYEELSALDIGSWFAPEFSEERVPTLGQVLDVCMGKAGVMIELKYHGREKRLEERVAEIVEAKEMTPNVVVISLKPEGLKRMRALRPSWKVGLLQSVAVGNIGKLDVDFFAVNATFASRAFVRRAHRSGKEVLVWTVNDAVGMSTLMSRGVDGIITDKPALAKSVLEQRAALSPPERLLVKLATLLGRPPAFAEQ